LGLSVSLVVELGFAEEGRIICGFIGWMIAVREGGGQAGRLGMLEGAGGEGRARGEGKAKAMHNIA
jgi:hypothetical protein